VETFARLLGMRWVISIAEVGALADSFAATPGRVVLIATVLQKHHAQTARQGVPILPHGFGRVGADVFRLILHSL